MKMRAKDLRLVTFGNIFKFFGCKMRINQIKMDSRVSSDCVGVEIKIFTWVELRPSVSAITSLSDGVRYFWKANLFSSSFNWCAVKAVRDFRFFFVATFWPSKAENSDPDFPKASEHVSSSKALSGVSGVSSRISSIRKDRNFA